MQTSNTRTALWLGWAKKYRAAAEQEPNPVKKVALLKRAENAEKTANSPNQMSLLLTPRARDQATLCLRDIQGILQHTRNPQYQELDEIQTVLASRNLQIAPIPKLAPYVEEPAAPAAAPTLTPQEKWKFEQVAQSYRAFKAQSRPGYVYKLEPLGDALSLIAKLTGIDSTK